MLLPTRSTVVRPYFWLTMLLIAVVGIAVSAYVYAQVDTTGRSHIIERANTLATAIPVAELQALSGSSEDLYRPEYQVLKTLLMREHEVSSDVRFIYLIGKASNDELFFYVDSEDPTSEDYSPPGEFYPEATPLMYEFFSNGKSASEGPDRDRWGIWVSAYAPVRDANGNLIAMLGMDVPAAPYITDLVVYAALPLLFALLIIVLLISDRTRRRRKEDVLAQRAEFLSIASHQIRTPLTGMRWALEQLLDSKTSTWSEGDRTILSLTHESSSDLIARVNNLLDVTTIEHRGGVTEPNQSVLMHPLFESIVESLMLSAKRKGITITLDSTLPNDLEIVCDRQSIQHVFFNLIGNAVKYTKPDTEVTVSYGWTPEGHQFSIRDRGMGIAASEQTLIFEGYHRTQQAMESGEAGSGLGLYLTKQLVELQHGTISVHSTVGEGSTFTVTLPN
ncbi:MAG: two-component system, OmpR family, aerobic respiration control sensor histidine kinase ArcB [Parcubacteria bacterium C7867-008]|nr:MAG: two-component system, OmpR family, aerobic respiration control sensor histidine kinase ArcB [Parcubacteria bacterium C7867-008]